MQQSLHAGSPAPEENRQLLTTHEGIHSVNGRNARLDKLLRIISGTGIYGITVDIQIFCWNNWWPAINRFTGAIEDSSDNIG